MARGENWASRAHMTIGAFYVSVGLALLCAFLAGWNVTVTNTAREAKQRVAVLEAERQAEQRASRAAKIVEIKATRARCMGAIRSTEIANTVIIGFKEFLNDTANDTEALIKSDPGAPQNVIRERIVRKRRAQASKLEAFRAPTQEQCNENAIAGLAALGIRREQAKKTLGIKDAGDTTR